VKELNKASVLKNSRTKVNIEENTLGISLMDKENLKLQIITTKGFSKMENQMDMGLKELMNTNI
jgi:hypothetical protein